MQNLAQFFKEYGGFFHELAALDICIPISFWAETLHLIEPLKHLTTVNDD